MKIPILGMQRWLTKACNDERQRVADEAGISVGYLWLIAGGHRKPSEDVATKLHKATSGEISAFSFFPKLAAIAAESEQPGHLINELSAS
jgi:transcriptional regulator with XRE-family HTH domain